MGKKRGTSHKGKRKRTSKEDEDSHDMDDEIDAFHKQRDMIPLDVVNGDAKLSDEDDGEEPIFFDQDIDDDDDDFDDDDDDDDEDEGPGLAAKIARQKRFLQAKFGGVDDGTNENDEEEEKRVGWGGKKPSYYGGVNHHLELESSDDEALKEEEEEILRLQSEKAKFLEMEDFGPDDVDENESDRELTLEEISVQGKRRVKVSPKEAVVEDMGAAFEEVKKDLNALSREEQMDIVYSSAPELVGLLLELNVAVDELESKVNPLLSKVTIGGVELEGGIRYLEVKQLLLLAYCQAITFYLLLKSEGHSVRDHPVIARLVEIKSLLDKTKELDGNLPSDLEEIMKSNYAAKALQNPGPEDSVPSLLSASVGKAYEFSAILGDVEEPMQAQSDDKNKLIMEKSFGISDKKEQKHKHKNDHIGEQSMEMLKVRAALEEKLKQKGVFSSLGSKPIKNQKNMKPVNRQLETYDDFDDDVFDKGHHGLITGSDAALKLSELVPANLRKQKVISGDEDLPKRDDIGERRRKHELRVLAGVGVESEDDAGNEPGSSERSEDMEEDVKRGESDVSEDEFYTQVKQKRAAKLSAKAEHYKRTLAVPSLPETVDGKRLITHQIEKNRGLTRPRNKLTKNPRKKYRTKHDKARTQRKGQVRDVKKPYGPYGGESSGINAGISRSVRF